MKKINYCILVSILFFFVLFFGIITQIKPAKAQTSSTTFPVDEAGIAAYVKLDSVDITDLTEALNYFSGDKRQGETYVIGQMKIENGMAIFAPHYSYPHLYIGLDGWIVAYYLNGEETSKIIQWKGYTPGTMNTTTLKDAIDVMCANIGVKYSTEVKYYDFKFPNANKMAVIAETVSSSFKANSFSLTIPGVLYEAPYSIYGSEVSYYPCWISLTADGNNVFSQPERYRFSEIWYGYYEPLTLLTVNVPHSVVLATGGWYGCNVMAATVLIYQTD